jgi:hypothetical protein
VLHTFMQTCRGLGVDLLRHGPGHVLTLFNP